MEQDADIMIVLAGGSANCRSVTGQDQTEHSSLLHFYTPTFLHSYEVHSSTSTLLHVHVQTSSNMKGRKSTVHDRGSFRGRGSLLVDLPLPWVNAGRRGLSLLWPCVPPLLQPVPAIDRLPADEGCAQEKRCVGKSRPSTREESRYLV
jgi:hypothetical protein